MPLLTIVTAALCEKGPGPRPDPVKFARAIGTVEHEAVQLRVDNGKVAGAWFELQALTLYAKVAQGARRG